MLFLLSFPCFVSFDELVFVISINNTRKVSMLDLATLPWPFMLDDYLVVIVAIIFLTWQTRSMFRFFPFRVFVCGVAFFAVKYISITNIITH